MRVIVAGSTTWDDREIIRTQLAKLPAGSVVVYGDAPGADEIGGEVAETLSLSTEPMVKNQEDRERFGRVAWKGLNERMLATGVDRILAFHADVNSSTGTKHLIELATKADVPVEVFSGSEA